MEFEEAQMLETERRMQKQKHKEKYGEEGIFEILCELAAGVGVILITLKVVKVQPVAIWPWWKATSLLVTAAILYLAIRQHRQNKLDSFL